jgi:hypothetical protein
MNTNKSTVFVSAITLTVLWVATPSLHGPAPISIAHAQNQAAPTAQETLVVPFTSGTTGVNTTQSYSGNVVVTVWGTGQASGTQWSDAFYLYTDSSGQPITPWHPTEQYNWSLWINGGPADHLVTSIPPYTPTHTYTFTINVPAGPLNFAVGDAGANDNTGAYTITLDGSAVSQPDLDVAYVARLPRYDYDAAKNQPAPGDLVTFEAHIANRGVQASGTFTYSWHIDNSLVASTAHPSIEPGGVITLTLPWTWQPGPHTVRMTLDPSNLIVEMSEQNNLIEDPTNALAVGFWVEQSVYNWFNSHQIELGIGSVSWDDWAQRQLRVWNQMFSDAVYPLTPQGVIERVRLDKVTVVPDGALPACATNFPAPNDKTIDLQWGFPSELVGIPSGHACGALNFYLDFPENRNIEYALLHELSHARYLVDLYGMDVGVGALALAQNINSTSTTLTLDSDVASHPDFPVPAYLAVERELVICQTKVGNQFKSCSRGAEGTRSRSHAAGAGVHRAVVRVQDGQHDLIQGGPDLPFIGPWGSLYVNRYPDDLMSSIGPVYRQHSAYAWNRIAGKRPVCGNYNSPCNIGEYLNDLPEHNIFEILGANGRPLFEAVVEVYRGKPFPGLYYGRAFFNLPDAGYVTDFFGQVDLGASPFAPGASIIHTYGHSNAVILLKISSNGQSVYRFFEVTQANEAYWAGNRLTAKYTLQTDLTQGPSLRLVFLPLITR